MILKEKGFLNMDLQKEVYNLEVWLLVLKLGRLLLVETTTLLSTNITMTNIIKSTKAGPPNNYLRLYRYFGRKESFNTKNHQSSRKVTSTLPSQSILMVKSYSRKEIIWLKNKQKRNGLSFPNNQRYSGTIHQSKKNHSVQSQVWWNSEEITRCLDLKPQLLQAGSASWTILLADWINIIIKYT